MNPNEGIARLWIVLRVGIVAAWLIGLAGILVYSYVIRDLLDPLTFLCWIVLYLVGGAIAFYANSTHQQWFSRISLTALSAPFLASVLISVIGSAEEGVDEALRWNFVFLLALLFYYVIIFGVIWVVRWVVAGFMKKPE